MGKRDHPGESRPSSSGGDAYDRPNKVLKIEFNGKGEEFVRAALPDPIPASALHVPNRTSMPDRGRDRDAHLNVLPGDNLSPRYKVLCVMGEGTFGRVLECWDRVQRDYCAIKVVRGLKKYKYAALIELEVLETLKANDPARTKHTVTFREWFTYRDHVCMVFDRLGPSLFDFLRKNGYKGFPFALVQSFAWQMLEAVEYLHRINLCHTDLKPENVLCTVPDYKKVSVRPQDRFGRRVPTSSSITVIDFGSATFEDQHHSSIVSTRHYRAPEIILGLGWSYPCDIWSLGCIFLELLTGDALYSTHDNHEHLVMIERTCGRFPGAMLKRAEELRSDVMRHFDASGRVTSVGLGRGGRRAVDRLDHVRSIVAGYAEKGLERAYDAFTDLVERMLALDPQLRITASEALGHEFFRVAVPLPDYVRSECSVVPVGPGARASARSVDGRAVAEPCPTAQGPRAGARGEGENGEAAERDGEDVTRRGVKRKGSVGGGGSDAAAAPPPGKAVRGDG